MSISQSYDISYCPRLAGNARCNCRSGLERLMNPNKVVVHVEQRNAVHVVLNLLREGISEPSKTAHVHAHREILSLDVAGRNVQWVGCAENQFLFAAVALRGAVALLRFGIVPKMLDEHRVIDVIRKGVNHGIQVDLVAIAGKLYAGRQTIGKVLDELGCAASITLPYEPGNRQLAIGVQSYPSPHVASYALVRDLLRHVLLLAADECPDFIDLNALRLDVANSKVLVFGARRTNFFEQPKDCAFRNAGKPCRGADRATLYQRRYYRNFLFRSQLVHTLSIPQRSGIARGKCDFGKEKNL